MDMEHEIPKKLGVLATHGDGEPPKTLDDHYVKNILYHFDNPKKTSFNYVMGDTLDQREYFRDYRLTQKGKLLWDQIHMLHWYARQLCLRYDYTCCSRMKAPHLPFSCKFNDNETLASYARGIYDYYDVQQIEEFVVFKGAYEIASLIETYDATLYNLKILPYLNIVMIIMLLMPMLNHILMTPPLSKKRLIFCRNLWKKKLMKL